MAETAIWLLEENDSNIAENIIAIEDNRKTILYQRRAQAAIKALYNVEAAMISWYQLQKLEKFWWRTFYSSRISPLIRTSKKVAEQTGQKIWAFFWIDSKCCNEVCGF